MASGSSYAWRRRRRIQTELASSARTSAARPMALMVGIVTIGTAFTFAKFATCAISVGRRAGGDHAKHFRRTGAVKRSRTCH